MKKLIIKFLTCAEYKRHLEEFGINKQYVCSEKFKPTDGMKLSQFGKLEKTDILHRINSMSRTPHKSNLLVMFSNGYSFSWTQMQIAAEALCIVRVAGTEKKKTPFFELLNKIESDI